MPFDAFLVRRRPRIGIDEQQRGVGHARAHAARPDVVVDHREADAVVEDLLDLVPRGFDR
jgi:hypothetical protein